MRQSLKIACGAALLTIMATATGAYAQRSTAGADIWFGCVPAEVSVFANRTHIRCQSSLGESSPQPFGLLFGDPRFFAVPASDVRLTSAAVTLGQAAITSNRRIWIAFDYFDATGEAYGCRLADCRSIHGLRLEEAD